MTTSQMERFIRKGIVVTEQVAHVTFHLVKAGIFDDEDDSYDIYTESEQRGLERYTDFSLSREEAMGRLREAMQELEETLERKRSDGPTAKQLHFLFRHKIPIPMTLTWGEAHDLIEEKLSQIEYEKQEKQQALRDQFNGFAVKDKVSYKANPTGTGTITKLYEIDTFKGAYVRLDRGGIARDVPLDNLQKIVEGSA